MLKVIIKFTCCSIGRFIVYYTVCFLTLLHYDMCHWAMGALALLMSLKTIQMIFGSVWLWCNGEAANKEYANKEQEPNETNKDRKKKIQEMKQFIFARFAQDEWALNILGIRDRKVRRFIDSCVNSKCCLIKMVGGVSWLLHDLFFRFNTQTILASIALVLYAPDSPESLSDKSDMVTRIIMSYLVGGLAITMSFLMAFEVLLGSTLMGNGYSRYFHFKFECWDKSITEKKRKLLELKHFSVLAIIALCIIASVCTSFYLAFNDFAVHHSNIEYRQIIIDMTNIDIGSRHEEVLRRTGIWLEFFYFATTTFTTVGFGDIHPNDISPRVIVTLIHALSFTYVLFLLQTLLGQKHED